MPSATIQPDQDVLSRTRARADAFRAARAAQGTLVVHLMSAPGSGKTALLAATARRWQFERPVAVLVGDLATDRDAQRLRPWAPTAQLTTGGACHLDLDRVERAFAEVAIPVPEFLFIEDVGNLVCPASSDLGHHLRVVLLSVTEGDDKAGKYPKAFRSSQALVITKQDLAPHVPFCHQAAEADARGIQPALQVLSLSAQTGEGLDAWLAWLVAERQRQLGLCHAPARQP